MNYMNYMNYMNKSSSLHALKNSHIFKKNLIFFNKIIKNIWSSKKYFVII
ncbi:hypothetical protein Bccel_0990 [Pseudobacteroides cellulosolvens ATCC 35603 = DSM 2933]|uniref:Uncharacterized protein n=1 Tax=Pseudobacteroides cellulosolvens ATCC 35603 = DSM 2933 TaxID=398512 RepID=A0A0L6JJ29_9FIRM|nr:hypothetical protein Bccel_0990 [Pseudobacteroides cellulosolvens ATCC 35603 = DSM 2933]